MKIALILTLLFSSYTFSGELNKTEVAKLFLQEKKINNISMECPLNFQKTIKIIEIQETLFTFENENIKETKVDLSCPEKTTNYENFCVQFLCSKTIDIK